MRLIDADALQREYMQFHDGKRSVLVDVAPTIEPERKIGRLINPTPYGECSECGYLIDSREGYNFCPNCGADMRGGDAE